MCRAVAVTFFQKAVDVGAGLRVGEQPGHQLHAQHVRAPALTHHTSSALTLEVILLPEHYIPAIEYFYIRDIFGTLYYFFFFFPLSSKGEHGMLTT